VVAVHEGGYSELYVPFCGLAVIEQLAHTRSKVRRGCSHIRAPCNGCPHMRSLPWVQCTVAEGQQRRHPECGPAGHCTHGCRRAEADLAAAWLGAVCIIAAHR
jgi:hypothetical protein